jgi:hypothetical protein
VTIRSARDGLARGDVKDLGPPAEAALVDTKWLRIAAGALVAAGLVGWALGAGLAAMWIFVAAAVTIAFTLPLEYALVSPLFMSVLGWLVDMLPFVVLAGWGAVLLRWALGLLRERRMPRGGRWIWLPIGLVAWTAVGVTAIDPATEAKHFVLLFGIQVLASATLLAGVDVLGDLEARSRVAGGLLTFVLLLSVAVFLEWVGVDVQSLQDTSVSPRAEAAYGVDAFPNDTGMIKYARAKDGGAYQLKTKLDGLVREAPEIPDHTVFLPLFDAFDGTNIVVRFNGSARPVEKTLAESGVTLVEDNVGISPANTVPRLRSFPRNALTYAGICAALLPFAFFFAWTGSVKRRWFGRLAIAACLFGAGFALARGAWAVIAIAAVYLLVDGMLTWGRKLQFVVVVLAGAATLTAVYLVKYNTDPLTARAGGQGSVNTRSDLYTDTLDSVSGLHLITGFGTTRSRTEDGATQVGKLGKYVPPSGSHSTYLNYLFRTGLPGVVGILALYALAAAHARASARSHEGSQRRFATLAAAAVVIVSAHALILSLYVEPVYTLAISLVLGMAMAGATNLPTSILPWRTRTTA